MLNLKHKHLKVWKRSIDLVSEVYLITDKFPAGEKFGLISQLRRASVSISSNIAEGAARKSDIERRRFYEIARSSLVEVDTQMEISISLNYTDQDHTEKLNRLANETFAMLSVLV